MVKCFSTVFSRWPITTPILAQRIVFTGWLRRKHLYNICTTSSTLVQHCTNVIQMFPVYWVHLEKMCAFWIYRPWWVWTCGRDWWRRCAETDDMGHLFKPRSNQKHRGGLPVKIKPKTNGPADRWRQNNLAGEKDGSTIRGPPDLYLPMMITASRWSRCRDMRSERRIQSLLKRAGSGNAAVNLGSLISFLNISQHINNPNNLSSLYISALNLQQ